MAEAIEVEEKVEEASLGEEATVTAVASTSVHVNLPLSSTVASLGQLHHG